MMITDSAKHHRFCVGSLNCLVVTDGTFAYSNPAGVFFGTAPAAASREAMRRHGIDPDAWDMYVSPYPSLLIDSGDRRILVDTGAGAMAPTTGHLLQNLRAAGIDPDSIDTVALSHAHPDHIGGNFDAAGRPAFRNARYVLARREWDYWMSGPDLSSWPVDDDLKALILESPRKHLPPLGDQLVVVDEGAEIAPGIEFVPAPGHTPGHMAVSARSDGERFVHLVDAFLHPIHVEHPGWYSAFDLLPEETVATRRRVLTELGESNLVLNYHFPFPGLGRFVAHGDGWSWRPVDA